MATILDSFVGSCIKKVEEIITDEAILILGVEEELIDLQRKMRQIQCFLNDAEERRIQESAVNNWLSELKDAMYDADDIIDLAKCEGSKLLANHPSSSSRKSIACDGLSIFSCFPNIQARREIAIQIRSLNTKLEKISKYKVFSTLENIKPIGKDPMSNQRKTSRLTEPNLVGKEITYASIKIMELLLAHKEKKAYKLAIVGTGGVGKTTLAQKLYNDPRIKGNFSKQAWICVSREYSEVALLKEVLRSIGVHQEQGETLGELQSKLAENIEEKSIFLVLDDVWQPEVWANLLRTPLHAAATRIILITTRDDTIAHKIGVEHTHRVELMPIDVGWELLWRSMNIDEEKEVQNLRNLGNEIVQKCGGLPLAIKVVGSILATKDKTENEWRKILSKNAWSINKLPAELSGALYLSYDELPKHLKQCFLYCALYPEDSTMYRDCLIRCWVAEGFIEEQKRQLLEDTAEEYYYELISRNLLQPDPNTLDKDECKMHDLLRQLACHLSREECFVGDPQSLEATTMLKLRRVCVVTEKEEPIFLSMAKKQLRVRTLKVSYEKSLRVENTVFKRLPYLRVLDLTNSLVQSIPDNIKDLIHLRLLDLDGTNTSCLPESIGSLKNLQILNLERCQSLHSLPLAITQLCNLRRLGLSDTPIKQVPKGIERLAFLNDLEGFPVGGGHGNTKMQDGWDLEELVPLSHLRQLDMIMLERAFPFGSTTSLLEDKHHLKVLRLCCSYHNNEPYSEEDINNVESTFEELIPPYNLENLNINGFFGRRFPTWLSTHHLPSIKYLKLINCISWGHLLPIGQLPNLRYLRIQGATTVSKIGPEFLGVGVGNQWSIETIAFPKLEWLIMKDMPNLEEWCMIEEDRVEQPPNMQLLPCLKELQLVGCPKLRALPQQLAKATSLKELFIREASCLKVVENLPFLSDCLLIDECEGLERVSNLSHVRELYVDDCPNLRCIDKLHNLQRLWLCDNMHKTIPPWVYKFQQQHRQLHGEDLDLYTWC